LHFVTFLYPYAIFQKSITTKAKAFPIYQRILDGGSQPYACAVSLVTEGFRTFAACIDMNGDKSIQKAVIGGVGNIGIARAFPHPNHPHRLKSGGCQLAVNP